MCTHKDFRLSCNVDTLLTTSWNSKVQKCYWFWHHPQQTVDTFLKTLWTLDLTFRRTVSRLLTLSDWVTFWSLSDDVSNQQLNVIQLNDFASWWFSSPWLSSPWLSSSWLSSHCLRSFYAILHVLYTYSSKIISAYFCGRLQRFQQILVKHINCHVQRENLVTFLDFRISQGSVATYCKWDGSHCVYT